MKKDVKELTLFFIFSSAAIKVSSSDKICESRTLDFIKLTTNVPLKLNYCLLLIDY